MVVRSSASAFYRAIRRRMAPETVPTRRRRYGSPRTGRVCANGNFVRTYRPRRPLAEPIPKLPAGAGTVPKPFKAVPPVPAPSSGGRPVLAGAGGGSARAAPSGQALPSPPVSPAATSSSSGRYFSRDWFRVNAPILILNFGSVCTLVGFSRQDVLELRGMSMAGSICSVIYFSLTSPSFVPMAWSTVFAATNAFKIARIIDGRKGSVVLTEREEEIYEEHFLDHGVTPKLYSKVLKKATSVQMRKGEKIVRSGEQLDRVYLVVSGRTRASFLGRKLTAASSAPGNQIALRGGDAGAWIGESAFLESLWRKEQKGGKKEALLKRISNSSNQNEGGSAVQSAPPVDKDGVGTHQREGDGQEGGVEDMEEASPGGQPPPRAIHTIVADDDDCELLCWEFADLEELMLYSADLRSAMTCAMTGTYKSDQVQSDSGGQVAPPMGLAVPNPHIYPHCHSHLLTSSPPPPFPSPCPLLFSRPPTAAIVGKVVNMTVSRAERTLPTWSTWLDHRKYSGAATVTFLDEPPSREEQPS